MFRSLQLKKGLLFVIISIIVVICINLGLTHFVKNKVNTLLHHNKNVYYKSNIEDLSFNLVNRSLTLKNISISPVHSAFDSLQKHSDSLNIINKIYVQKVQLKGIHLLDLLLHHNIKIKSFTVQDVLVQKFTHPLAKSQKKKSIQLDSIPLKKIEGIAISRLTLNNIEYQVFNIENNQLTTEVKLKQFKLGKIQVAHRNDSLFRLHFLNEKSTLQELDIKMGKEKYQLSLNALTLNPKNNSLTLNDLKYFPQIKKEQLARLYRYNNDIFNVSINTLTCTPFNLNTLITGDSLVLDRLAIQDLNLHIYKDKTKPFNKKKRPKLPHQTIAHLKFPLYIKNTTLHNANLFYEERLSTTHHHLKINLQEMEGHIDHITSIDSLKRKPMTAILKGKIMKKAPFNLNLKMHLNNDYFSFDGQIGSSPFKLFDQAIFPSLGLKIIQGHLNSLKFNGAGNAFESKGEMALLYNNLEAQVFKSHSTEENELVSWAVNSLLHKSNPGKNGHTRTVEMYTQRVPYKGFGNLLWKTLQSGMVNTFSPIAKISEEKVKKKHRRKKKKR